jgi:hypothetical protein
VRGVGGQDKEGGGKPKKEPQKAKVDGDGRGLATRRSPSPAYLSSSIWVANMLSTDFFESGVHLSYSQGASLTLSEEKKERTYADTYCIVAKKARPCISIFIFNPINSHSQMCEPNAMRQKCECEKRTSCLESLFGVPKKTAFSIRFRFRFLSLSTCANPIQCDKRSKIPAQHLHDHFN